MDDSNKLLQLSTLPPKMFWQYPCVLIGIRVNGLVLLCVFSGSDRRASCRGQNSPPAV